MKRKRKNACPSPLLDDSPKRTKVHAQRKFAQGSNVNSPVITPIRELESDSPRNDVLPEPVELLPIKRPNTEDFLTFLCFRGTPILPPSLNFFNTASIVDTNGQVHEIKSESSQKNGPIDITKCGTSTDKPFIAFGVRKRADPIVISRQMDRKRRHALAIQALRRKYQEQKMAKIRALTISKLSEKVTNRTLVKTNTVSKTETVTKKTNSSQKTKVVATKHVKVTTQTLKTTMRPKMGQKMCLRSFRGHIVQKELPFIKRVGAVKNVVRKNANQKSEAKKIEEEISEKGEPIQQQSGPKKIKESTVGTSSRVTRSGQVDNKSEVRRKQIKKRILRLTTVKKTVVSQRKSRSIKAKKRLRTVQKLSVPENNAAKAVKKDFDEVVNAKKLLVGAKKYAKQAEKKDTLQVNKKSDHNLSNNTDDAKDTFDIKKDFKKVTGYKKESKEIIEKDKKQVNKRVDINKEISRSSDIKRNPKNMVETKKSIRISNIIQRKEIKNANNTSQRTSEEYKRNRRVQKEVNKNEEEKSAGNKNEQKLQKKSLIVKKTRSQSEEQAKDLNEEVDADSKYMRKEKLKSIAMEEGAEMKRTSKVVVLGKLNKNENTEENCFVAKSCSTPETSEKLENIAETIQDSGSNQYLENKSNSKKKSSLDRKHIKDKMLEVDNIKPVSNEIKNLQAIGEEINSSESKMKYPKSVETQGYKLKEKTIMEDNNIDETEIDLKTVGKDKIWPVNISNSKETYSESESEVKNKSVPEEEKMFAYFNSVKVVDVEKLQQPVSRKIMNFKEVVEAILEAKDSDESDNETKILNMTQTSAGPTSSKIYWNNPTIDMVEVAQEIPTEYVDVDKKPPTDIKRDSKKINIERVEDPYIHEIIEELESPDVDSKIFPRHIKIWDTKEIASGNDVQKKTEVDKDKKEKVIEKFSKDEKRQSSESQKSKKVTSGKEKSITEVKNLAKVMNKKKNRSKSLRKESTEEIEELNNITDKMRKLDTKTTEPSIEDDKISEEKSSVENEYKNNKSDEFLSSKDIAETKNPEMHSLHDQTSKKINFVMLVSNDKMKSETTVMDETVRNSENTEKDENMLINTEKEHNQKLKKIAEATKAEILVRGKPEKQVEIDKNAILNTKNVRKSQELLMKSTETKNTEKPVEKYKQSDQNIEYSEQYEQGKQVTGTEVSTENETEIQNTKRQNVKRSVSDKTVEDLDRIEDPHQMLEIQKTEKGFTEKMHKDPDGPKKLIPTKSKKEVAKRDEFASKNEKPADIDHSMPKTSQRPSRKTKEAAAIYMEILSHKLVRESRIDDDNISIDSFPELPNVKKTEQRENELKKAQAKTSRDDKTEEKTGNTMVDVQESSHDEIMDVEDIPDDIKLNDLKHRLQSAGTSLKKPVIPRRKSTTKTRIQDQEFSDSDDIDIKTLISRMSEEKVDENDKESIQKEEKVLPKRQSRNIPQTYRTEDSYGSDESFHIEVKVPRQKKLTRSKTASKLTKSITADAEQEKSNASVKPASSRAKSSSTTSDESTTSDVNLQVLANKAKSKKFSKTKSVKKVDQDFSDSDEEPLSKLTVKSVEGSQKSVVPTEKSKDEPPKAPVIGKTSPKPPDVEAIKPETKPKRECARIPQNYLPMFSSSDEEDIFHGFDKKTEKTKPPSVLDPTPPLLDLLNKDLSRRFGKEKVNMSNEQIEQWLKDSALAGSSIRKENDNMLKFGEKIPNVEKPPSKPDLVKSAPAKPPLDRKLIFRKHKKEAAPNVSAFSPENESSVYAFGEDNEEVISTPFRRPSRRPSSTATSRSEDESSGHFRKPSSRAAREEPEASVEAEDSPFYVPQKPSKAVRTPLKAPKGGERLPEPEDFRYKIPSSPSASSSSSNKHRQPPKPRFGALSPLHSADFPADGAAAAVVEAPVFHPSEQEFQDPLEYIERIRPKAEPFGVCRIVPPAAFKPECKVADDMRFTAYDQRVHKMLLRWGPNFKELMAIRKYLATQNISLVHPPWIGGMEIDLPKLYQTVQTLGGLKEVIEKKKWPRVSELMKIPKSAQDRVTKLDDIYCKYLLPYDTLSMAEREKLFDEVETDWAKRESKKNAANADNDSDLEDDVDECITKGRNMALNAFYRIARNTMSMYFKTSEPSAQEVEQEYWKYVMERQNHICVNSGSIDSGSCGYGFAVAKNSPFARHPWNLKVLTNNSGSILRSIAPLMAVTVPTLHVGMVFSACCWYRDPHGLPWIEYLHTGGSKVWYAAPTTAGDRLRAALSDLAPGRCRDDPHLWLPSDAVMAPPAQLVARGASLARAEQRPGQFVVVFGGAFSSALSTGYTVSESVFFAPPGWLPSAGKLFGDLRAAREPSMFSLDRLVIAVALDARSGVAALRQAAAPLGELCEREARRRARLAELGRVARERLPLPEAGRGRKRRRQGDEGDYECDVCRTSLFVSMIFDTVEGINYCLDHGIEMLEAKKSQLSNCKFMFTYDDDELAALPDRLKAAMENKGQKKVPNKYAGMPTLLTK